MPSLTRVIENYINNLFADEDESMVSLRRKELAEIFAPIVKRPMRPTWLSSAERTLSDRPPVLTPAEEAATRNGHSLAMPPPGSAVPASPAPPADQTYGH